MKIEDISRICLTPGRTAQDQRHFAIGDRLFAEIVVDYERGAARVAEILSDGSPGERRIILHRGGVGRSRRYDDSIVHGSLCAQGFNDGRDGRTLLPDGHVDAVDGLSRLEAAALIDDGVDGEGGLSGLAVADDELALAAADWNHRIHSLEACLQRLGDRFAVHHSRGLSLQGHLESLPLDLAHSVQRLSERIHHAADHPFSHIDGSDAAQPADRHTLLHLVGGTEKHGAHVVLLKVHHHALHTGVELQQLAGLGVHQAVDAGNPVAHLEHLAGLFEVDGGIYVFQLSEQDVGNLAGLDSILRHMILLFFCTRERRMSSIWRRTLASNVSFSNSIMKPPSKSGSTSVSSIILQPLRSLRRDSMRSGRPGEGTAVTSRARRIF